MSAGIGELPAEVLRGLIAGWSASLPWDHRWDWLRAEMDAVAGGAAAVGFSDAPLAAKTAFAPAHGSENPGGGISRALLIKVLGNKEAAAETAEIARQITRETFEKGALWRDSQNVDYPNPR